jgi:hypothetical protein
MWTFPATGVPAAWFMSVRDPGARRWSNSPLPTRGRYVRRPAVTTLKDGVRRPWGRLRAQPGKIGLLLP